MAWTTPRTWVDGEVVTASIMNTHIRDNLNELRAPRTCRVYRSTSLTVTTAALVNMDGKSFDDPGWHSTITNPSRITQDRQGLYLVQAAGSFAASSSGPEISLCRNGLAGDAFATIGRGILVGSTLSINLNLSAVYEANGSTDYFSLAVDAANSTTLNGGEFFTWLSVTYLGTT